MKNQWNQKGIWPGGTVPAIATSPDFTTDRLVLAATLAGIYRSTDGGRRWAASNSGAADLTTHTLAFAPVSAESSEKERPPIVFAGTQYGRLYRSSDGGLSWQEVTAWAGLGVPLALAISPTYPTDGTLFVATAEGIFRSFDRGLTWQSADFGLLDLEVLCIACAPDFAGSEVVWAGTAGGGFYRSRNAARSWRESGAGLADSAIQCLAVSPTFVADKTLFVGTETAGVFCSTDAGASWFPSGAELAGQSVNTLSILPGFHLDRGNSPDQDKPQTILAGTSNGIFLSVDGGEHWRLAHRGPASPLTIAAGAGGEVIAGDYQAGISRSEDGGQTWRQSGKGLAAHTPPLAVISPEGVLFVADSAAGVAYSQDEGMSWRACNDGLASTDVQALALGGDRLFIATSTALYHSPTIDLGWTPLSPPLEGEASISLLAVSPNFEQHPALLLGTQAGSLYLSEDAGATWQKIPAPPVLDGLILRAIFSAGQRLNLITATEVGPANFEVRLWQSADQGNQWAEMVRIQSVKFPAGDLASPFLSAPELFFLAFQNEVIKLVKNSDGRLEVAHHVKIEQDLNVTAILLSPTYESDQSLFAATNKGIFHSSDGGVTWQHLGHGLEDRPVVALLLSPQDKAKKRMGAVTLGGAVWWLENGI